MDGRLKKMIKIIIRLDYKKLIVQNNVTLVTVKNEGLISCEVLVNIFHNFGKIL